MRDEKKFQCGDCGSEKNLDIKEESAMIFQPPNCCGKKMLVAS